MSELKNIFCRYDMVCDSPGGVGLECHRMPAFFTEKPELETSKLHVHEFYEIVWFREGGGTHRVDFDDYPVAPGTIFFISPGQFHSFDQRHDQSGVVLKICGSLLNDASDMASTCGCGDSSCSSDHSSYLKYNVFNTFDHKPYKCIAEDDFDKIETIIKAIEDELSIGDALGHREYLQALVKMLIIRAERNSQAEGQADVAILNPVRTSHKTFLAFRRLLDEHYQELHTVKDYANLLGITTKTLTQYVNECSSYSPLELINNRIALEAKRLLCYSNFMVKEIAYRLGFEDPSYFVKFFKREVHHSPADYRDLL